MNILDTDIDRLKKDQKEALKEHICSVLDDIKKLFCEEKYQEIVDRYLEFSPAGDGWGQDNYFINFDWNREGDTSDISDILNMASRLSDKKISLPNM